MDGVLVETRGESVPVSLFPLGPLRFELRQLGVEVHAFLETRSAHDLEDSEDLVDFTVSLE